MKLAALSDNESGPPLPHQSSSLRSVFDPTSTCPNKHRRGKLRPRHIGSRSGLRLAFADPVPQTSATFFFC